MGLAVKHGYLLGVVGHPRLVDGIWFCGARGVIEDPEDFPSYSLRNYTRLTLSWAGDFQMGDEGDSAWVRAAIPSVYGFAPLHVADGRWLLLDTAFVAVLLDGEKSGVAWPFACTGNGIVFSRLGPTAALRDRIAAAFWSILFTEGADQLSDFIAERVAFDTGDGYDTELVIGCLRGEFYANDLHDEQEDERI